MTIQVFLTVLTGVLVVVLGQFVLRLVVDPIISFKGKLGEVSHYFLANQASITNASASDVLSAEAKQISAELLAKLEAVTFYGMFAHIFRLPSATKVTRACGELNNISHLLRPQSRSDETVETLNRSAQIFDSMKEVETNLQIRVRFG